MDSSKFRLPFREDTVFSLLAFCIFLVPLAFSLFSYENFESVKFSFFLIFTGAAAAVFFFRQPAGPAVLKSSKYFFLLLAFFEIWAVISAFLAGDRLYAFFGFYYRYTSGVLFYLVLIVFIWLLINILDAAKTEFLLKILVADALAVSLISYLQSFGGIFYEGLSSGGFDHGPSLLGNPNYSAMFLAAILPFAVYFFYKSKRLPARIYYAFVAFLIIFACLLLASRGALLAVLASIFIALALLLIYKFPKKYFFSLLIAAAVTVFMGNLFLNVSRPDAVSSAISATATNTASRFYAWDISFKGIAAHPWLGTGPGNFVLFFEKARSGQMPGNEGVFDDPHNLFILLAATGGIPLMLSFLGVLSLAAYCGLKQIQKNHSALQLALVSSLAAWAVAVCFNPVPIPMYLLLGVVLCALFLEYTEGHKFNFSLTKKRLFICLATIILFLGADSLVSEHLLGLAKMFYLNNDYQTSLTLSGASYFINPTNNLSLMFKIGSEIALDKPTPRIQSDMARFSEIHPLQAATYVTESNLYAMLYSDINQGQYLGDAIFELNSAIKMDPYSSDWYGQLALYYYRLKNYGQSEISVKKDLALNKTDFSGWILLAKLYQIRGDRQDTIIALTQAFDINPGIPQLKYILNLAKNLPDIKQVPIEIATQAPGIN